MGLFWKKKKKQQKHLSGAPDGVELNLAYKISISFV